MFMWRRPAGKTRPSAVLLRQVPIRFDDPARSWLGGVPQMPDSVAWPRTRGDKAPLHFIAQIACADLPPGLWDGLGPRKGWLLLFVETLQMEDDDTDGLVQVLHIDRLGPERAPPEDMPTVRHAMSDYVDYAKPNIREGVPKPWRRWPVDIIAQDVPESRVEDGERVCDPPAVIGAEMYGAPEDDRTLSKLDSAAQAPLTWRGALYFVDGIARALVAGEFERKFRRSQGGLPAPTDAGAGWTDRAFAAIEARHDIFAREHADAQAHLEEAPEDLSEAVRDRLQSTISYKRGLRDEEAGHRQALTAILNRFPGPDREAALNTDIARLGAAHLVWGAAQRDLVEQWRARILTQDPEASLPEGDWQQLKSEFSASRTSFWCKTTNSSAVRKVERTLFGYGAVSLRMALREDVLDLYARSAAARASLPGDILAEVEPKLRHIMSAMPHRMGGLRETLQDEADPGDPPLLFQIASDDALGWRWGDAGALFIHISPLNLRLGRFNRAYAWIEGH